MTVVMFAAGKRACLLMEQVKERWEKYDPEVKLVCKVKCKSRPDLSEEMSLSDCVKDWFDRADALVFFCASGIAVRSIAPCLKHKSTDPAVLVLDETGKFCISLLSGHAGGANELAAFVAGLTGGIPVITTATDREGKFSVDDFARKNGLFVTDWELAKEISVCILNGEQILIRSELPMSGKLPPELIAASEAKGMAYEFQPDKKQKEASARPDIHITAQAETVSRFGRTLRLVPAVISAGIGCKKGTPEEKIAEAVSQCLSEARISPKALKGVASIDLKAKEPGILSFCKKEGLPYVTYSAEELKQIKGDFTESSFVTGITGVSNVCERSAAAAAGAGGRLICRKKIYDGVTVALAQKKGSVIF